MYANFDKCSLTGRTLVVLPRSGPEPRFELDFWSSSPWFGPWFSCQPEPDRKIVLGSRSSRTVPTFWFGLPEPFRTLINFDFEFASTSDCRLVTNPNYEA